MMEMDFKWTKRKYNADTLMRSEQLSFPFIVRMLRTDSGSEGYEMFRVHSYVTQKRVLAKDKDNRILSIPRKYAIKFELVDRSKNKYHKPHKLSHHVARLDRYKTSGRPLLVKMESRVAWSFNIDEHKNIDSLNFGTLQLLEKYTAGYLRTNKITTSGAIEKNIVLLPVLPDAENKLQLAVGLRDRRQHPPQNGEEPGEATDARHTDSQYNIDAGKMAQNMWKRLQQQYSDSTRYVKFNKIHGLVDITLHKGRNGDKFTRDYENIGQRSSDQIETVTEVNTPLPMTPPTQHRASSHAMASRSPSNNPDRGNDELDRTTSVTPDNANTSTASSVTLVEVNHQRGGRRGGRQRGEEVSTQTSISLERNHQSQIQDDPSIQCGNVREVSTQVNSVETFNTSNGPRAVNGQPANDLESTPNTSMTSSSAISGFDESPPTHATVSPRATVEELFPMVREPRVIRRTSAQRTQSVKRSSDVSNAASDTRQDSDRVQRSVSVQRMAPRHSGATAGQINDGRWRFFSDEVFLSREEPVVNHAPSQRYNRNHNLSYREDRSPSPAPPATTRMEQLPVVEYSPGMAIYDRRGRAVVIPDQLSPRYHSTASLYATPVYEEQRVPGSSGTTHATHTRHAVRRQASMPMKAMKTTVAMDPAVRGYSTLARATVQGHAGASGHAVRRRYSDARQGEKRVVSRRPQSQVFDTRHYIYNSRHASHANHAEARHYSSVGNLHQGSQATLTVHGPGLVDTPTSPAFVQATPISVQQVTAR